MAAAINATAKDANANSFGLQAAATAYFEGRTNATDWTGATSDNQIRALIQATELMTQLFSWKGAITVLTQRLPWPRSGVWDREYRNIDQDTVPEIIQRAQFELALFLLKSDRVAEPGLLGQGFNKAKVGPLDVNVDPNAVLPYIPTHVVAMLEPYGELIDAASRTGFKQVKLLRT